MTVGINYIKIQSIDKYETSLATVITVKGSHKISVGDNISNENNEKFEIVGIQMPTRPNPFGLTGLIVKAVI